MAQTFGLISTPREPVCRLLNMARGKYWSSPGNTAGHVRHFSRLDLEHLAASHLHR
jgi:hypothetical protein